MNWIKQNLFLSTLIGSTLVLCGLLAFIAIKGGSKYAKAKEDYDAAFTAVTKSEKLPLYPTKDNSQAKAKALDEYREAIEELSGLYTKYQIDASKLITTQQFTGNIIAANEEVTKAFGVGNNENVAQTKLPEDFFMGFEAYKGQLAKSGATVVLDYQLNAIKHVLLGMSETRPSELIRIYREKISEESDAVFVPEKNQVARKFGYEIVFRGSESSVRDFITKLGEKENYYCVIRSIRINNQRDTPPKISDAKFETPREVAPDNPFGAGFFDEPTAPAPEPAPPIVAPEPGAAPFEAPVAPEGGIEGAEAPVEGEDPAPFPAEVPPVVAPAAAVSTDTSRILYQVLGDEELQVFVRFDVLLFLPKKEPAKP